jgi:hypothetical protein
MEQHLLPNGTQFWLHATVPSLQSIEPKLPWVEQQYCDAPPAGRAPQEPVLATHCATVVPGHSNVPMFHSALYCLLSQQVVVAATQP